jgi:hypothetical protein
MNEVPRYLLPHVAQESEKPLYLMWRLFIFKAYAKTQNKCDMRGKVKRYNFFVRMHPCTGMQLVFRSVLDGNFDGYLSIWPIFNRSFTCKHQPSLGINLSKLNSRSLKIFSYMSCSVFEASTSYCKKTTNA